MVGRTSISFQGSTTDQRRSQTQAATTPAMTVTLHRDAEQKHSEHERSSDTSFRTPAASRVPSPLVSKPDDTPRLAFALPHWQNPEDHTEDGGSSADSPSLLRPSLMAGSSITAASPARTPRSSRPRRSAQRGRRTTGTGGRRRNSSHGSSTNGNGANRSGETSMDGEEGRLHRCEYCAKTFRKRYHLTRHVRLHTNERPYPCSACSMRFTRSDKRTTHERRVHGLEICRRNGEHNPILISQRPPQTPSAVAVTAVATAVVRS